MKLPDNKVGFEPCLKLEVCKVCTSFLIWLPLRNYLSWISIHILIFHCLFLPLIWKKYVCIQSLCSAGCSKFSFYGRNPHMVSQCCRCGKNLITHITWISSTSWSLFKITHSACNQIPFSLFFLCVTLGLYSPSTFSPNFSWPYLKFFYYFDYFPHTFLHAFCDIVAPEQHTIFERNLSYILHEKVSLRKFLQLFGENICNSTQHIK